MKEVIGSAQVLTALRSGPFREPAHVWLYEVRNGTGYRGRVRYADALVISAWPSRGIWFAGVEVKVDRYDWLREVDDPEKASEIQRFCDYWWVAAPPGVVRIEEVPANWGYYEIDGKKAKAVKDAPRLEAQPLTREFVASVFRNGAESLVRARQQGHEEGYARAKEDFGPERIAELQKQANDAGAARLTAEQKASYAEADLNRLRQQVASFEQGAGMDPGTISRVALGGWDGRRVGKQFVAAGLLAEFPPKALAKRFADVAAALAALEGIDHAD